MKTKHLASKDEFKFQCKIAILSVLMFILSVIGLSLMIIDCFIFPQWN